MLYIRHEETPMLKLDAVNMCSVAEREKKKNPICIAVQGLLLLRYKYNSDKIATS